MKQDNWVGRKTGRVCATCMSFATKLSDAMQDTVEIGRCRRHAPTMGGFPVVYPTDWCGDHKLDENKLTLTSQVRKVV